MFFGMGLDVDQPRALDYWSKAVSLGHKESEYHLCHAFADQEQSVYDPQKAMSHCQRAEAAYEAIEDKDDGDREILRRIRWYRDGLSSM